MFLRCNLLRSLSLTRGVNVFSLTIVFSFLFHIPENRAHGQSISLAWDQSEGAEGYRIMYGPEGILDTVIDTGLSTTVTIPIPAGKIMNFAVVAYKNTKTSGLSNIVKAMTIKIETQYTDDWKSWTTLNSQWQVISNPPEMRVFRVRIN